MTPDFGSQLLADNRLKFNFQPNKLKLFANEKAPFAQGKQGFQ
ncbi:hypothetical protein SAMN02745146_2796 [Hymenobacter daecheongensis DSM 21074]|uniref:Uncharacterized protein n=1 Tax=Hymenobacter daecheongensis DSM 21074 TaxID=1121955 RepID=A0A1M6I579_9BACT|nr:hypothetical protein SAMN02745146_2796 [Hymenobacter daecheongensis DSM 21074]